MLRLVDRSLADDDIRFMFKDRLDELRDIIGAVLIVCVCVDDDISTTSKTGIKPCHESFRQSLVSGKADDMVYAPVSGNLHRIVRAAVINNQVFNFIYSIYSFW